MGKTAETTLYFFSVPSPYDNETELYTLSLWPVAQRNVRKMVQNGWRDSISEAIEHREAFTGHPLPIDKKRLAETFARMIAKEKKPILGLNRYTVKRKKP